MRSRLAVAALFLSAATGCTHQQRLMPTPSVIADGHVDPFRDTADAVKTNDTPVFVVSAREPRTTGNITPARYYTNDRTTRLRLGKATVRIGEEDSWEELAEASRQKRRSSSPIIRLRAFEEYGVLWSSVPPPNLGFDRDWTAPDADRSPADQFVADIEQQFELTQTNRIYIFVHGFNTSYTDNIGLAAEFWHYLGRHGVMINFSWPSKHSVFSYQEDKANAAYATRQFRKLLEFLAAETSVSSINLIAHSAGNPVVVESLRDLRLIHYNLSREELRRRVKIGRVVLAAPDMDLLQAINASMDGFDECAEHVAMYASTSDKALGFASMIFGDTRLGASVERLTPEEREALRVSTHFEAIDVSLAQKRHSSFLGHSYFHQNPWVSSDLGIFLRDGRYAEDRGLVFNEESAFWEFPKNYTEVMEKAAESMTTQLP